MKKQTKIEFEESSGNVYADLGLEDSEELHERAEIGYYIVQLLKEKDLKQKEIAKLLGIHQAEVSHLLNGHFSRFTIDKLFDFLKRMDQKVSIEVRPRQDNEPFHHFAYSTA